MCWRAHGDSVPKTAVRLLDRLRPLVGCVRCCSVPDPQSNSKGSLAPLLLVARLPTNVLTRTNQSGGALELLNSQQSQGVPHQNSNTILARATLHDALKPTNRDRVGCEPEVILSLAAACRKP